jgi:hypothetical protein
MGPADVIITFRATPDLVSALDWLVQREEEAAAAEFRLVNRSEILRELIRQAAKTQKNKSGKE